MLLVAGFGWAKPVQFDEKNLKNPKTDVMKIAVAGPLSNALTAMVLSIIFLLFVDIDITGYHKGHEILREIFMYGIYINWGLMVFNLIPIPPLDGSHLLLNWFRKYPAFYSGLYKYGTIALFGLLIVSVISKINLLPIWPVSMFLGNGFLSLFSFL
jgi:Zn-dependent protease